MEPIIIYKSEEHIKRDLFIAERLVETELSTLSTMFKNQCLMLTNEHFINFMNDKSIQNNRDDNQEPGYIGGLLLELAEADIKRANIKSEKIRIELIRRGTEYPIDAFAAIQQTIDSSFSRGGFELSDFDFSQKGIPSVSDIGKKRIESKYTATLSTDDDIDVWNTLSEFCTAFAKLRTICHTRGHEWFLSLIDISDRMITESQNEDGSDSITLNPKLWLTEKNNILI